MAQPDKAVAGKELLAKLRANRRRLSALDRADDDWRKANLLAKPVPGFERLLGRVSRDPAASVRKRERNRTKMLLAARSRRALAHQHAVVTSSRPRTREQGCAQPVRNRGSRRSTTRSTGPPGSDDSSGESEPPGLAAGWRKRHLPAAERLAIIEFAGPEGQA